ncbi:hypothetical protein GF351_00255 [Candidatus Woesearchaeota archaeon]|nr:hypothetical protein [Candidatus Woesearchaeota archaeon]
MSKEIFKRGIKAKPHPMSAGLMSAKKLLFTKVPFNIITALLIISLTFFGAGYYWSDRCPEPEPVRCPSLDCEKCPPKIEYRTVNLTKEVNVTVEKYVNVTYFVCDNGTMVRNRQKCNASAAMIEIEHDNQNSHKHVTLAVDEISWYMKDEEQGWGKITAVNFTILNEGNETIAPKMGIRVWTDSDEPAVKSLTRDIFIYDTLIEPDSWFKAGFETEAVSFRGENVTVKLVLVNQLPDPDKTLVMAQKKFSVND